MRIMHYNVVIKEPISPGIDQWSLELAIPYMTTDWRERKKKVFFFCWNESLKFPPRRSIDLYYFSQIDEMLLLPIKTIRRRPEQDKHVTWKDNSFYAEEQHQILKFKKKKKKKKKKKNEISNGIINDTWW